VFYRSIAWLLVLLVTVPFTAPFSTCDLSMLLSSSPHAAALRMAVSEDGRSTTVEEAAGAPASGSVLEEDQFNEALLTTPVTVAAHSAAAAAPVRAGARTSISRTAPISLRL